MSPDLERSILARMEAERRVTSIANWIHLAFAMLDGVAFMVVLGAGMTYGHGLCASLAAASVALLALALFRVVVVAPLLASIANALRGYTPPTKKP